MNGIPLVVLPQRQRTARRAQLEGGRSRRQHRPQHSGGSDPRLCGLFRGGDRAAGVIRHTVHNRLLIGENDNQLTPRLLRLGDWLRRAGFDAAETTDIRREIWLKLWGNLTTNPISLLTEATVDRIVGDPWSRP
jgi:ketopantoate reductase